MVSVDDFKKLNIVAVTTETWNELETQKGSKFSELPDPSALLWF